MGWVRELAGSETLFETQKRPFDQKVRDPLAATTTARVTTN